MAKKENDVDSLFTVPLSEFTAARNALAARLKQAGKRDEAEQVKALGKPSISAWAVNQLYWRRRETFARLLEAGKRFREAQAAQLAGKTADIRAPRDARREAVSELSKLAAELLSEAGSPPTSEKIHRVATTLEAISAYESLPGGLQHGRLTDDVDPPGFEAFTPLLSGSLPVAVPLPPPPVPRVRKTEETRPARLAAAKAGLQDAERILKQRRATAQIVEEALKKAAAQAKAAEKEKQEAEERVARARAASEEAGNRARRAAAEAQQAAKALEDAARAVEKAAEEVESLR